MYSFNISMHHRLCKLKPLLVLVLAISVVVLFVSITLRATVSTCSDAFARNTKLSSTVSVTVLAFSSLLLTWVNSRCKLVGC